VLTPGPTSPRPREVSRRARERQAAGCGSRRCCIHVPARRASTYGGLSLITLADDPYNRRTYPWHDTVGIPEHLTFSTTTTILALLLASLRSADRTRLPDACCDERNGFSPIAQDGDSAALVVLQTAAANKTPRHRSRFPSPLSTRHHARAAFVGVYPDGSPPARPPVTVPASPARSSRAARSPQNRPPPIELSTSAPRGGTSAAVTPVAGAKRLQNGYRRPGQRWWLRESQRRPLTITSYRRKLPAAAAPPSSYSTCDRDRRRRQRVAPTRPRSLLRHPRAENGGSP